ncbi:hypothetical protein ACHAP5_003775 [Fusarium lateritium]
MEGGKRNEEEKKKRKEGKEKEQDMEEPNITQSGYRVTSGWTFSYSNDNDKLSEDSGGRPMMQVPEARLHDMSFLCLFGEHGHWPLASVGLCWSPRFKSRVKVKGGKDEASIRIQWGSARR